MLRSLLKGLARGRQPLGGSAPPDHADEFLRSLLKDFYVLAHHSAADNYDYARYSHDGVDRSTQLNVAMHAQFLPFLIRHAAEFRDAAAALADGESAGLYRRLLLYRLLGHLHVVIRDGHGWSAEARLHEQARQYDRGESALRVESPFGGLRHHRDVPAPGGAVALDCWSGNIVYTVLKRQYFLERGALRIGPRTGDVVIDAGACFGDTAVVFARAAGESGRVYAFDPLPVHQQVIRYNARQNGLDERVTGVPLAVGERTAAASAGESLVGTAQAAPAFSLLGNPAAESVPLTTLDDFAARQRLAHVDFV
jgi:FkbM family methyltransferase